MITPEDVQTVIRKAGLSKFGEAISDAYEEVMGRELSDAAFDVLATSLTDATVGALEAAVRVDEPR